MSITERERLEQLDLIAAANRQMAERAKAPEWYHWALGALSGGMCACQELGMPWATAYYPVYLLGLMWIVRAYKRHTGMWIPGYRAGRTRWVAVGGAIVMGIVFFAAIWLSRTTGLHGFYLAGGVLIALLVTAVGYLWEKAYRRDLGVE